MIIIPLDWEGIARANFVEGWGMFPSAGSCGFVEVDFSGFIDWERRKGDGWGSKVDMLVVGCFWWRADDPRWL